MKNIICLLCLVLCSCITEYTPKGIDQMADILVVEGIITNDETYITLSRSEYLIDDEDKPTSPNYVSDAMVYVECDDGTLMMAEYQNSGIYLIKTGTLDFNRKYRLIVQTLKVDCPEDELPCQVKVYEYCSVFSSPIATAGIDSIFWMKKDRGEPVTIHVATQSSNDYDENVVSYYLWSYVENWEIIPPLPHANYPRVCWNEKKNNDILLGSATKTASGNLIDNVLEIDPSDIRISELYRIIVKQNAITKQAYEYLSNIKKNAKQTGSIFSPIPLELIGNIVCTTDPSMPVIGYVDVSTTTKKQLYISRYDNLYESPRWDCLPITAEELKILYNTDQIPPIPSDYLLYQAGFAGIPATYVKRECLICYGTQKKPDDWPR